MVYRDDREALAAHLQQLEQEWAEVSRERDQLEERLERESRLEAAARARLDEAGPGGGSRRDAYRDRIDLAGMVLLAVCVPLLYWHWDWNRHVPSDQSVIPAILMLGTPALLATLVLWPYRSRGRRFVLLLVAALLLALLPLANIAIGLWEARG